MNRPETSASAEQSTVDLDVRALQPRERHHTILDQLERLGVGETLRLINDHDPVPLRYQLEAEFPDHYRWVGVEAGPEVWVVYAPFEPIPLEGVLGEQGFEHVAEQIGENDWRVRFRRP